MAPRIDLARKKAIEVLDALDITAIESLQRIEELCAMRGVAVRAESLRSLHGVLIRHRRLIVYNADIPEIGKQRFTIAHELGHWELHPGLEHVLCTAEDIQAYRGSSHELEANAFAAELLMPGFLFTEAMRYKAPIVDDAKRLAERFQTSFTAALLRMVQFSDLPVFAVFSVDGKIKWYQRSKRAESYFFKQIGTELDGDSLARYCTDGIDDAVAPETVETSAWFPDDFNRDRFSVIEQSVELGDYGVTVSIVTVDD
ncbi:MAG: ImmA/IrrE family metallo-endopeptidase [Fimbriimonadaceae bacterium]|nr:ImmA/IrrE family metallo-endopeptidase [Fimbriimonadaceae bacterium]